MVVEQGTDSDKILIDQVTDMDSIFDEVCMLMNSVLLEDLWASEGNFPLFRGMVGRMRLLILKAYYIRET